MKPGPGWKSWGAKCAERRGMLTRADMVDRGCPQVVLDALRLSEWHHVWRDGRVRREYFWTERQVIRTVRRVIAAKRHAP